MPRTGLAAQHLPGEVRRPPSPLLPLRNAAAAAVLTLVAFVVPQGEGAEGSVWKSAAEDRPQPPQPGQEAREAREAQVGQRPARLLQSCPSFFLTFLLLTGGTPKNL